MSRYVTDALNANSPQGQRERLRLYREAVTFIAFNDDPIELSFKKVSGFVSVGLVAGVFNKTQEQVASAVIRIRREDGKRSK